MLSLLVTSSCAPDTGGCRAVREFDNYVAIEEGQPVHAAECHVTWRF